MGGRNLRIFPAPGKSLLVTSVQPSAPRGRLDEMRRLLVAAGRERITAETTDRIGSRVINARAARAAISTAIGA
jgi:hypothetical protein